MPQRGRARNLAVQNNFLELPDATRKGPIGVCKHCHWYRAWQTTNNQKHLDSCVRYSDFVAAGEPEDELDRLTHVALDAMLKIFAQRPEVSPQAETAPVRPVRQPAPQQPWVTVERLPKPSVPAVPSTQREQMMEAVLGMVWSALAATGSPEVQPNTALWNLVNTVAPNALTHSRAAPRHAGLPGQYNTPTYGQSTPNGGAASGSTYQSGG
ncbi:hypothetical protein LTR08_000720 [Meristemomyces frigidus]|nr:hypothetical protein LTR08_000720 [Meristemomyces frigidus]